MPKGKRYPANLTVDYPTQPRDKTTVFFRLFMAIPIWIIVVLLIGTNGKSMSLGGFIFLPTILLIVFRQKYPQWWFDWNLAITQFLTRVTAYAALLTDAYPSTDEEQGVHIALKYPKVRKDLDRWLPLVKWLLAIPHYVVLAFLNIAAFFVVVIAWFAILFTGQFPKDLFKFVVGVIRWNIRVTAYAFLLITDEYPPFTLQA